MVHMDLDSCPTSLVREKFLGLMFIVLLLPYSAAGTLNLMFIPPSPADTFLNRV